jgi:hypothetical protein
MAPILRRGPMVPWSSLWFSNVHLSLSDLDGEAPLGVIATKAGFHSIRALLAPVRSRLVLPAAG